MKKAFHVLSEVFLITSVVMLFVGAVIGLIPMSATLAPTVGAVSAILGVTTILCVGMFLRNSKNDTASRIGHAFILAAFLITGITGIGVIASTPSNQVVPMDAVFALVAFVLFALYYVAILVLKIIDKSNKEEKETK